MGKCLYCGKRGLFLKVNENGRCQLCESAHLQSIIDAEEQKKKAALCYYNHLAELFSELQAENNIPCDPIARLNYIPTLEAKLAKCNYLIEETKKIEKIDYFDSILEQHCDYTSKSDRYLKYAYFSSFNLKILIHQYSDNKPLLTLFSEKLIDSITDYSSHCSNSINRIRRYADFESTLRNIPTTSIALSDIVFSKLATSNLDELVKYSKITSKTSYDRIGNFVVIDTETTGLSSFKNEITEISAIRFEDWTPVELFHSMVKPKKEISAEITSITGITNEMVSDAPPFYRLIPSLLSFIGKSNLVGYNLPFDLKFLYRNGLDFTTQKRKYYDVLELAKSTLKKPRMKWDRELEMYDINYDYDFDVIDHKLTTICSYYNLRDNTTAHRASSDALATGLIFMKLAKEKIPEAE